jgi:hypothetical protein
MSSTPALMEAVLRVSDYLYSDVKQCDMIEMNPFCLTGKC